MRSSDSNPDTLSIPENMSAAIIARCHAENQLELIGYELDALRKKKTKWKRRLKVCLRRIDEEAI